VLGDYETNRTGKTEEAGMSRFVGSFHSPVYLRNTFGECRPGWNVMSTPISLACAATVVTSPFLSMETTIPEWPVASAKFSFRAATSPGWGCSRGPKNLQPGTGDAAHSAHWERPSYRQPSLPQASVLRTPLPLSARKDCRSGDLVRTAWRYPRRASLRHARWPRVCLDCAGCLRGSALVRPASPRSRHGVR